MHTNMDFLAFNNNYKDIHIYMYVLLHVHVHVYLYMYMCVECRPCQHADTWRCCDAPVVHVIVSFYVYSMLCILSHCHCRICSSTRLIRATVFQTFPTLRGTSGPTSLKRPSRNWTKRRKRERLLKHPLM